LVAPVVCVVVAAGAEDGIGEIEWVMEQPAWCAKDATRAQEELIAITISRNVFFGRLLVLVVIVVALIVATPLVTGIVAPPLVTGIVAASLVIAIVAPVGVPVHPRLIIPSALITTLIRLPDRVIGVLVAGEQTLHLLLPIRWLCHRR
jgi:hypothetical protein